MGDHLECYQYFVGDLWERYGQDAWLGPWKQVYAREADSTRDVVAELEGIADREAQLSAQMVLDGVEDAEAGRQALSAAYDDVAVTELEGPDVRTAGLCRADRGTKAARTTAIRWHAAAPDAGRRAAAWAGPIVRRRADGRHRPDPAGKDLGQLPGMRVMSD